MTSRSSNSSSKPRANHRQTRWTHQPGHQIRIDTNEKSTKLTKEELIWMPSYVKRHSLDHWTDYQSVCYNALLDMEISLTRYFSCRHLDNLGIREPVMDMLAKIGLGSFVHHNDLYAEMTRQFLASVEAHYVPLANPVASKSYLTYFYNGERYEITFEQICKVYGFDPTPQHCFIDRSLFRKMDKIWPMIASRGPQSNDRSIKVIRNPVLRVVAMFLRRTFMPIDNNEEMTPGLLFILLLGLDSDILVKMGLGFDLRTWCPINLGAVFASQLPYRKFRGLGPNPKFHEEAIGNLLTPIFYHNKHASDMDNSSVSEIRFLDNKFWCDNKVFRGNVYEFSDDWEVGNSLFCRLPILPLTTCKTEASIKFDVPQELLCTAEGDRLCDSPSESTEIRSGDEQVGLSCPLHGQPFGRPQHLLPPIPGYYCLDEPLAEDATVVSTIHHIGKCVTNLHQMQSSMWMHLSNVRWYQPPRCCNSPPSTTTSPSTPFISISSDDSVESDPSYSKSASFES